MAKRRHLRSLANRLALLFSLVACAAPAVAQTTWVSTAPAASTSDFILTNTGATWSVNGGSSSGYVVSSPQFPHSPQGLVDPQNLNFTASATFTIGSLSQPIYLDVYVDDDVSVRINNVLIFTEGSGAYSEFYGMNIVPYLQVGSNSIEVNVINTGGASGLAVGVWTVSAIPEPGTYAAIMGGVAVVGAVIARRSQRRCRA